MDHSLGYYLGMVILLYIIIFSYKIFDTVFYLNFIPFLDTVINVHVGISLCSDIGSFSLYSALNYEPIIDFSFVVYDLFQWVV